MLKALPRVLPPSLYICSCKSFSSILIYFTDRLSSIVTWILYLMSAFTNPGYLLGCSEELAARAGAYDARNFEFTTERKNPQDE